MTSPHPDRSCSVSVPQESSDREAGEPIVINVNAAKPGSKRVERDEAGNIVRVVDERRDDPEVCIAVNWR